MVLRAVSGHLLNVGGHLVANDDCCCGEECQTPCDQCPDGCGPATFHAIGYYNGSPDTTAELYWQSNCCWSGAWSGGGGYGNAVLIYDGGWEFYVVSEGGNISCGDLEDGYSCPLIEFNCTDGGSFDNPDGWGNWLFEVTPVE